MGQQHEVGSGGYIPQPNAPTYQQPLYPPVPQQQYAPPMQQPYPPPITGQPGY